MSGYVYCHCRDCFDITVGEAGEFCADCVDAGCPDYQGVEGMNQECQREDAYERSSAEHMPGNTHVKVHADGTVTVYEGLTTRMMYKDEVQRATEASQSCCAMRHVEYPAGQEHCACLACNVDKAVRYDKEARRDQERA